MINCRDAKHLFGRYLDGQLSPSLATELHAHRLQCTDCQNELALLEACGDVIALDRCEPTLSASFTDRVLLARRARMKPLRRHWLRTVAIYGSPMAAAACLALMFSIVRPITPGLPTIVLNSREAAPKAIQEALRVTPQSPEALRNLEETPLMSEDSFLDALVGPVVEKSRTTAEGTRRGFENVLERLRQAISSENERIVRGWHAAHPTAESDSSGPATGSTPPAGPQTESSEPASPTTGERIPNPL